MSSVQITGLPNAIAINGTEAMEAVQAGSSVQVTTGQIATYAAGLVAVPSGVYNVKLYGAKGNGTADDTVAIQAALTAGSGAAVFFPFGTYIVSAPLYVSSGTTVYGVGAGGSKIVPTSTIAALPTSSNPHLGSGIGPVVFTNVNYQAYSITDSNIVFDGLDIGPLSGAPIGCHAIFLRMVQNSQVMRCNFQRLNDCVAHLACDTTLVEGCYAQNYLNCAYDHWDNPINATVRDCTAIGAQSAGTFTSFAVLFNTDDGFGHGVAAKNLLVENVRSYGCSTPIFVDPLLAGAVVQNVTIRDCYFNQSGVVTSSAVIVFHAVTDGLITGNTIETVTTTTTNPIYVGIYSSSAYFSSRITISDNTMISCNVTASALIVAAGQYNRVVGNKSISSAYTYAMQVDYPTSVVLDNDLPSWSTGYVNNSHPYGGATTPAMEIDADRVNYRWNFAQLANLAAGALIGTNGNAITLDTYEAGSWTPVLYFGAGTTGITYSTQLGTYVRIGKLVFVTCDIVLTSKGSSTGNATILGHPYSQGGSTSGQGMIVTVMTNISGITQPLVPIITGGQITFVYGGAGTAPADTNFANNSVLRFNGMYRVA